MGQSSEKFFPLSHLQKLRRCEQVAAVCYQMGSRGIEFLLVQTRGGRWTFPKGSTEPGLTHAQAAALEAFEEAGVHGRIEEASFARYAAGTASIHAHLCEVTRQEPPQEFGRTPMWFSATKAKRKLAEGRKPDEAREMGLAIDHAARIVQRKHKEVVRKKPFEGLPKDSLRQARFEAGNRPDMGAAFAQYVRREGSLTGAAQGQLRRAKVLQLTAPRVLDAARSKQRSS